MGNALVLNSGPYGHWEEGHRRMRKEGRVVPMADTTPEVVLERRRPLAQGGLWRPCDIWVEPLQVGRQALRDFPTVGTFCKAAKATWAMRSPHHRAAWGHSALCSVRLFSQSPHQESREIHSCNTEKYFHFAVTW